MGEQIDLDRLSDLDGILAVLLFGSQAEDKPITRDVDVCVVAPEAENKAALLLNILSKIGSLGYDVWIFEELPLYMKAEVIRKHRVLWCRDFEKLYSYFADFMKIWRDQGIRIRMHVNELL
jgi:hypothetical protein